VRKSGVLAGFLLVIIAALAPQARAQARIKLGVIAPLSGPISSWGSDVQNILLFANQHFGAGRIDIVWEDDQCLGRQAVTAAEKLVHVEHVNIAVIVCTESLLAAAPIFEQSKTLVISPAATAAAISNSGDYIFRTWPSDAKAAELLYNIITARHNVFGIITELRGYSEEFKQVFLSQPHPELSTVAVEEYRSEETDVRAQLLRLQRAGITGLFINSNSAAAFYNILRQVKELRLKVKIYGAYMPGTPAFLELAGQYADGIVYVDGPALDAVLTEQGRKLFSEYTSQNGPLQSADFVFPSTIEAFRRLIEQGGYPEDRHSLLYQQRFEGIFGSYSFDNNGDIQGVQHTLKEIVGGKPVVLAGGPKEN
jgi:branched-chain amino acid transport system substrate-binding protein